MGKFSAFEGSSNHIKLQRTKRGFDIECRFTEFLFSCTKGKCMSLMWACVCVPICTHTARDWEHGRGILLCWWFFSSKIWYSSEAVLINRSSFSFDKILFYLVKTPNQNKYLNDDGRLTMRGLLCVFRTKRQIFEY